MIRKAVIFYNSKRPGSINLLKNVDEALKQRKIKVSSICVNNKCPAFIGGDLALSLGGDGTAIFAARSVAGKDVPLLSINAGGLGFLSGVEPEDFTSFLDEVLEEKYKIIERFFLNIRKNPGKEETRYVSLNDCVIRSAEPRAFNLEAFYNDVFLSAYFGDGLIVSTPTGSTAYNLAALGPIIMPHAGVFSLTPICPHSLTHRPMILPDSGELEIRVKNKFNERITILSSVDGQENFNLKNGDCLLITKYPQTLKSLMPRNFSYFEVLRKKLRWGERK